MADRVVYPIVYVRGFAGGTSGIDTAADDPFYGFNSGATHIRVDGDGQPQFYQFTGPLLRLIEDEGYQVPVHGGQQAYLASAADGSQPIKSVWIYRFYDADADTFGAPAVPYDLPAAAANLLTFIDLVLRRTGAPKVWLVAHSMGGLICRSMISKVCPDAGRDAAAIVDKVFTYATPHNGIAFAVAGMNIPVPQIAPFGADIFNHSVMYRYLTPAAVLAATPEMPGDWDAHSITGFDPGRVFCLIGTNAADYGLVSKAVGPRSDGLVQIDNAYVRRAGRSFVHRSHSGRYGEVNSEEGYQNLRRFLFGTRRAAAELVGAALPPSTQPGVTDVWQAEVRLSIRGLPVLITEQTAAHFCPIELGAVPGAPGAGAPGDDAVSAAEAPVISPGSPLPLATVFLLDPARALAMQRDELIPGTFSPRCRYFLHISVLHLQEKHGLFFWDNHLETMPEWADALIVDLGPDPAGQGEYVWALWQSQNAQVTSVPDPITSTPRSPDPGSGDPLVFTIPLPPAGQSLLGPTTAIRLTVQNVT